MWRSRVPSNEQRRARPGTGDASPSVGARPRLPAWRPLLALCAVGGLIVGACSVASESSSGSRATLISSSSSTGWIRIGSAPPLHFETTTCSAQPNRFVAVGVGMDGDEKFLVRVRAKSVLEVHYGSHDELRPSTDEDAHQLTAQPAHVEADGHVIRGTGLLLDSAEPERPPVAAVLRVYCP